MQRFFYALMLTGITATAFCQENTSPSDKTFNSPDYNFSRRFLIDLGKGNKVQIELNDLQDLEKLRNADSLLRVFIHDMEPLTDSLGDPLTARRIDFIMDSTGQKKIRILKKQPKGSEFLILNSEPSSLKLEQDSIYITGMYRLAPEKYGGRWHYPTRYYRIAIFINQLSELSRYLDGRINAKLDFLLAHVNDKWINTDYDRVHLKSDVSISARQPKGYFSGPGDYFQLNIMVNAQNYKNYFVPSFSLGGVFIFANTFFKREVGLFWEPNYLFVKDDHGRLKTQRNDFITLTLGQGPTKDNDPRKESYLITILSFSYLIYRQGEYFEKGTFRIGGGRLQLFEGKTRIEPVIYFHDFFRNVTPGIRFSESF